MIQRFSGYSFSQPGVTADRQQHIHFGTVSVDDRDRIKIKQADTAVDFLVSQSLGIKLKNKRVLDIGMGVGYNTQRLKSKGADVYGIEPGQEDFNKAISLKNIRAAKAFPVKLQELPPKLQGTFDLATIFLWNIPHSERDDFMKALTQAIKPDGQVIITIADGVYAQDPDIAVSKLAFRYFEKIESFPVPREVQASQILVLSKPRAVPLPKSAGDQGPIFRLQQARPAEGFMLPVWSSGPTGTELSLGELMYPHLQLQEDPEGELSELEVLEAYHARRQAEMEEKGFRGLWPKFLRLFQR